MARVSHAWREVAQSIRECHGYEVRRPVFRLVAEVEVDVMDLDLLPPSERDFPEWHRLCAQTRAEGLPDGIACLREGGLQALARPADVLQTGGRRARSPDLDVALALLCPAWVLSDALADTGCLQHLNERVCVAGKVGEDVADGPTVEEGRAS